MNVKLQIYFKSRDGKINKRVIDYVNPDASEEALYNFVAALNNLTTNDLKSVLKVVNTYLDDEIQPDDDEITADDIASIFDRTYVIVEDADGVTQVDINAIFDGTYTPVDDPDGVTQAEIDALFADWN